MFGNRFFRRRPEIRDPLVHQDRRHGCTGPHDMPDTSGMKCRASRIGF